MTTENFLEKALSKKNLEKNNINDIKVKNRKKSYTNVALIVLLIISITITGMMFLKTKETIEKNETYARIIKRLESDNIDMKNRFNKERELISRYQKNSRELALENARLKRSNTSTRVKPKTYARTKETQQTYIKPKNKTNNKTYTPKQNINNKPTKNFQRYRGYKNLVSSSKITVRNDNRFKSNATIFGNYENRLLGNVNCDIKQNIYRVVDECVVNHLVSGDKLYLRRSNAKSIKNFDSNTHMIECQYSQQHGLMHDCNVKLKSI